MKQAKRLFLIDCSSIFFRSFYAIRFLNNSKGIPTNAIYGYLATVAKLLKDKMRPGDCVVACYDRPEPSFREEISEDYKANREEMPDDLAKQIPYIKLVNDALNIPGFEKPGFEADDLIGTLTKQALTKDFDVYIVSSDKDFGQLLNSKVYLMDLGKDVTYDAVKFKEKWGVDPHQMIDYLSIVGDASDNIKGVKGIGPKGAEKLLSDFKNLDDIYENLKLIKNERTRTLLEADKKQAYKARQLVTIHTDAPIKFDPEKATYQEPNRELLKPLLEELEFKAFQAKLLGEGGVVSESKPSATPEVAAPKNTSNKDVPWKQKTASKASELGKLLGEESRSALWLEISAEGLVAAQEDTLVEFQGESEDFSKWLKKRIQSGQPLAGFDLKSQLRSLHLEVEDFATAHDPLIESYLVDPVDESDRANLLAKYAPEFKAEESLQGSIWRLKASVALSQALKPKLDEAGLTKLLERIELPLIGILHGMESAGIKLDVEKLNDLSKKLTHDIQQLEKRIHKLTESEFNIASPKQLGHVLFDKLKLPVIRKTKTGFSTDSDVLEELKEHHPVAKEILEWRELSKLKNTYVDALPKLIDTKTDRVHTHFNQAVTSTGRLSSTNPNLQNIPIRTETGALIRTMFVPEKGKILISADYSQIELRILAHIANDPGLIRAFEEGLDIHTATASEIFEVPLKKVDSEHRRLAKAINFGIAYGMSDFGLAERMGIERKVASEFIGKYFQRYAGVKTYMELTVAVAKERGYVATLFGRRRYLKDINHSNRNVRMAAERAAINMPIQGTAADIMKKAMIDVHQKLKGREDVRLLLQVHDELVFEASPKSKEELSSIIVSTMEQTVKLKVPLTVSVGSGKNWEEAH